jgi:hypothetical protein
MGGGKLTGAHQMVLRLMLQRLQTFRMRSSFRIVLTAIEMSMSSYSQKPGTTTSR